MKIKHLRMELFVVLLVMLSGVSYGGEAICPNPTDCVYPNLFPSYCFATGPLGWDVTLTHQIECDGVIGDVDCDGDRDYCRGVVGGGVMEDCDVTNCDAACCQAGQHCEVNNCVSGGGWCGDNSNCPSAPDGDVSQWDCESGCHAGPPGTNTVKWDVLEGDSSSFCWGDELCCGDDTDENLWQCKTDGNVFSCSNWACCESNTVCVNPAPGGFEPEPCLTSGDFWTLFPSGNDKTAYCTARAWYDCDDSIRCGQCGLNWVQSGEAGVGEYASKGSMGCCGDDSSEYYYSCQADAELSWSGSCSSSEDACCAAQYKCVGPNSPPDCYTDATAWQVYGSGNDKIAYCIASAVEWKDCDQNPAYCASCADYIPECSFGDCWAQGTGTAFGEYTQAEIDGGTLECCGDDEGEVYNSGSGFCEGGGACIVEGDSGCTVNGNCCQIADGYATDQHCDLLHPDASGDFHCCSTVPAKRWDPDFLNMCIDTADCLPECTTPWDTNCVGVSAPTCIAGQFCCPVSYDTEGDCFSFSDSIMGAISY